MVFVMFFRLDLDHDHYGLEKLKKRVIEYLAVRKLKNSLKGKIAFENVQNNSSSKTSFFCLSVCLCVCPSV